MKSFKILILILLCFSIKLFAQDQILKQKVDLQYKEATLEHILKDLGVRYDLKFSYVNNIIPLSKKISVKVENKTLKEGLDAVLASTDIDYRLVNGQIVLRKNPEKFPQKTSASLKSEEEPVRKSDENEVPEVFEEVVQVSTEKEVLSNVPDGSNEEEGIVEVENLPTVEIDFNDTRELKSPVHIATKESEAEKSKKENSFFKKLFKKRNTHTEKNPVVRKDHGTKVEPIKEDAKEVKPIKENAKKIEPEKALNHFEKFIEYDEEDLKPFHFGLVYPFSNHFTKAPEYVNKISFHVWMGISKGVDGVEASGIGNVETDFVKGFQAAGIFNVVGGRVEGVQAAGIVNVNADDVKGAQFAGIANINGGDTESASFSGIGNIVSGNVKGSQFAGIVNIANNTQGIQVAGITNITAGDIEGIQIGGIINRARNVKGTQIGLINIADTVDGVSIGLLNFVKKGYRRFEIFGSESFHANMAFKIGVQRFYTILAAGARFENDFTWGYGLGFGSQFDLSNSWKLSIDATSYHILDKENIEVSYLNMNNNLRLGIDKIFVRHFAVTFGPSFNVMIRDHMNSEQNNFHSYSVYESIGRKYTVTMWPGFFAGIRF